MPEPTLTLAGRTMTPTHVHAAAAALAARVTGAPVAAVIAHPTLETVVAVVAGMRAGVPVVPIPPDSGPAEIRHLLTDSRATLLLTQAGASVGVPADPDPPAAVETVPIDLTRTADPPATDPPAADAPALILYTSGTTGPPKGAVISHAAIAADLDALAEAWQWSAADTLVHGLPLYHVHGLVLGILGALRTGCRLVHTGRPTPAAYAAAAGTLYFGVPTVWTRVAADPSCARALRRARLLVSGSAPLPATTFHALQALTGQRPVERYGMTETLITLSARADGPRRPGRVGTPLRGVETRIRPDGPDAVGELQVRGPTLFQGYVRQPAATSAAHTSDGWFRTGDAATVDADGSYRIIGRVTTDLIKSGGYRIGAGEVEDALLAHPAVREAAVIGAPHTDLGEEIVAFVVGDPVGAQVLIDHVATALSRHKRPRRVVFVDALPRNPLGKVQKHLLREGRM
jgi:fatty acid CoA ligase FadD36